VKEVKLENEILPFLKRYIFLDDVDDDSTATSALNTSGSDSEKTDEKLDAVTVITQYSSQLQSLDYLEYALDPETLCYLRR
jgi:hypothetical protein